MATKKQARPERCDECYSNRLVPIVEGQPDGKLGILELQGKISLRGCFEISEGSPLWACADCGEWVNDDAFCFNPSNREVKQDYDGAVKSALDKFESVEPAEIRRLNGQRFLRSFSAQFLNTGSFELQQSGESFSIRKNGESVTNSLFSVDRFCQICEWLGGETKCVVVRCNKEEVVGFATQLAADRIQVRKGDEDERIKGVGAECH